MRINSILFLLIISCSTKEEIEKSGYIGETLEPTSFQFKDDVNADAAFFVDDPSSRILELKLADMSISKSFALSNAGNEHTLASGPDGSYVIDFSTKHLEIIKTDGTRSEQFLDFQGTPVSAAFDASLGIMVMLDDIYSVGLLMLSETGDLRKSWLGGSLIAAGKSLRAGDIDSKGNLLLSTSDDSIAIVNIEESIDAKEWVSESFATDLENIYWIAPDSDLDGLSLLLSKESLAIFNSNSGSISEQKELPSATMRVSINSKNGKPHVITTDKNGTTIQLHFINSGGSLDTVNIPPSGIDLFPISDSYLDKDLSTFTYFRTLFDGEYEISKFRLSDNLALFYKVIDSAGKASLTPNHLFINKEAPLGYLQVLDFESSLLKELKGYNFEYFRQQ
ncbi:MAG: hypothetical protein KBD78_12425 [Oligoflexales bacterium]|nr:hypothetical protein [Oligoflexales bacterium]